MNCWQCESNIPMVTQGIRSTLLSSLAGELLAGLGSVGSSKLRMNMMTRPSSFFTGTTSISQLKHTPAITKRYGKEKKMGGECSLVWHVMWQLLFGTGINIRRFMQFWIFPLDGDTRQKMIHVSCHRSEFSYWHFHHFKTIHMSVSWSLKNSKSTCHLPSTLFKSHLVIWSNQWRDLHITYFPDKNPDVRCVYWLIFMIL